MGTIRDEFAPSSARAPHGRVGQRPRTSVGPVVQLKRLSARAKTHFALDPFRAGSAAEEPLAPWVRTEVPPETQARPARPRSYNRHEKWRSQGVTEAVCFITSTLWPSNNTSIRRWGDTWSLTSPAERPHASARNCAGLRRVEAQKRAFPQPSWARKWAVFVTRTAHAYVEFGRLVSSRAGLLFF